MAEDQWATLVDAWWMHYRLSRGGRAERKELSLGRPESAVAAEERAWQIIDAGGPDAI